MTERIDVYYSRIKLPQWAEDLRGPAYPKYLIYTNNSGQRRILRAGPDHYGSTSEAISPPADSNSESSYGPVRFYDGPFEGAPEYADHSQSLGELLFKGDDLSHAWSRMRVAFHGIEGTNYQYWPQGVNSNTVVDATLARSGYHPTYRDGTAGNDNWVAPDGQHLPIISTPGYNRLPVPPGYYEKRRRPRAIGHGRSRRILPSDLLEMSEGDFARATDGSRWREIWERA